MDLNKIKSVIESGLPVELQKTNILKIIAADPNSLEYMLMMLKHERLTSKDLIIDMNLELSRAHICIESEGKVPEKEFALGEIEKFYTKHKGQVGHCFKNSGVFKRDEPSTYLK